mmetsp:Transcript_12561/g.38954  ORF Transcript_12561/g.38954 Transcript_12561/m.38954 type:complete len:280 (+) Transcript_12561:82-921(+)
MQRALSRVAVDTPLGPHGAQLGARAVARARAHAPEVLGGVAANVLGAAQVAALLVKGVAVRLEVGQRDAQLGAQLQLAARGGQLAHVVAAHRVGPAEREGVVGGQVADTARVSGVPHQAERRQLRAAARLAQLHEARERRLVAVEERAATQRAQPLLYLQDVARAHLRAVDKLCVVARERRLQKEHAVRAAVGQRGGRPARHRRAPLRRLARRLGAHLTGLVARGNLLQHRRDHAAALGRVVFRDGRLGARAVHPNRWRVVAAGPRRKGRAQLARVERA